MLIDACQRSARQQHGLHCAQLSLEATDFAYACARVIETLRDGEIFRAGYWVAKAEEWIATLHGDEYERAYQLEGAIAQLAAHLHDYIGAATSGCSAC